MNWNIIDRHGPQNLHGLWFDTAFRGALFVVLLSMFMGLSHAFHSLMTETQTESPETENEYE